ncbi:MAG TPA: peptidylprolyl isomerase [Gemmatimonadaceae bacterium]|jgi:cyclophilin family peptidyl-prolyl cis-trans isomerase/HEAT repeat protein|nr:peptidylprolyl isomerase [Gemmatimonadaceae bacterium]
MDSRATARAHLIRIEDTRADEPAWVDSALASSDASLRRAAVLTVGRIGARAHRATLRQLAADPDTNVAAAALFSLGMLKDTGAVTVATAATRAAPNVAIEAAWLLGELGESGRAALLASAADTALGSRRRGASLLALARLKPAPVEPILPLLSLSDSALAWRTAYVLARARSPHAVRALLAATTSTSADVRDYAARGLARSLAGDSLGGQAHDALRRLLRDPSARVRVTAVRVLAGYGVRSAGAIADALHDPDASVRVVAASFAHLAVDSMRVSWATLWQADTSFAYRRALAESARQRNALGAEWSPWRSDARWGYRAAAAELDGIGSPGEALARLEQALRDADGRVRASAAGALAALADSSAVSPVARTRLRSLLLDPDFQVRATALGALTKGATLEDLERALDSYALSRQDRDLDARLAFWSLADSALRNSSTSISSALARRLDELPRPAEPLERGRAASLTRFTAWRDSIGRAREAGWYLARAREALDGTPRVARIETHRGILELDLFTSDAPMTVDNFVTLARSGYFDGQRFHRVVPNFVVQGGDPRGDGNGGPGHAIRDEMNQHRYVRGTMGMALSGPNTGGSQFFVTHSPQPHLDGGYTVFGQLRTGGDVLDRIVQGDRIVRVTIQ